MSEYIAAVLQLIWKIRVVALKHCCEEPNVAV